MTSNPLGSFGLQLVVRATLLLASLTTCAALIGAGRYPVTTLLVGACTLLLILELLRFVRRTNLELARFLDAVRYGDFSQQFESGNDGAGFPELGRTFAGLVERFRGDRRDRETELRHLRALIEHVPVPLITVASDERTHLWNNAARRMFSDRPVRRLEDLAHWNATLPATIRALGAGMRANESVLLHGVEQTLALECGQIVLPTGAERLISLLNIQSELDGTQLAAWQDLVSVLTHEIMNSLTPVTSLARTAGDLLDDARERVSADVDTQLELADAKEAVDTVARRAGGLMEFVSSYRTFTRLPDPDRSTFPLASLLNELQQMATVPANVELIHSVSPQTLSLNGDRQMLFQVLINLVQNATHALEESGGRIEVIGDLNTQGRVRIQVADNGPGIPQEIVDRVFVPFFTTRRDGTGVGLAFSRRVLIAHGGSISHSERTGGGAVFTLLI